MMIEWLGGPRDGQTFEAEGLFGGVIRAVDVPVPPVNVWEDDSQVADVVRVGDSVRTRALARPSSGPDPSELLTMPIVTYSVRRLRGKVYAVHPAVAASLIAGA